MTAPLESPIPILEGSPTTLDHGVIPVDPTDRRAGEKLVELTKRGLAGCNYYARTDGGNTPYGEPIPGAIPGLWARAGVAGLLDEVNLSLAPLGLELFVADAYRPIRCQQGIWDFFRRRFRAAHPRASEAELDAIVARYASDPRRFDAGDSRTWPLHCTGGAVDVLLREKDGALLDFGAGFDEMNEASRTDALERRLRGDEIATDHPALRHRRILFNAMTRAGFTNYAPEFWHYDYGDQMYALTRAQLAGAPPQPAFYPYIAPPETN